MYSSSVLPHFVNILCFYQVHTTSVFYYAHLCMKCSLGSSNICMSSLLFPLLLFSSILFIKEGFLISLLAILWNSAFRWVYLSFSSLLLASLFFSPICKASSDNHFAFLHFFFLGLDLIQVIPEWSSHFPYFLQFKPEFCNKETNFDFVKLSVHLSFVQVYGYIIVGCRNHFRWGLYFVPCKIIRAVHIVS